jgi:uncharacterized membrane protein
MVAEDQMISMVVAIMPLILIIAIVGSVSFTVLRWGKDTITDDEYEEDAEKTYEDAEKILMSRFARGEITSEEYSERMSRL